MTRTLIPPNPRTSFRKSSSFIEDWKFSDIYQQTWISEVNFWVAQVTWAALVQLHFVSNGGQTIQMMAIHTGEKQVITSSHSTIELCQWWFGLDALQINTKTISRCQNLHAFLSSTVWSLSLLIRPFRSFPRITDCRAIVSNTCWRSCTMQLGHKADT